GNVRAACRRVGMSAMTAYRWRKAEPDFAAGWDAAMVLAQEVLEDVLADRALDGIVQPVRYHGMVVGERRIYDNRLLLAHLARLDKKIQNYPLEHAERDFEKALGALTDASPPAPATPKTMAVAV
ncbi:MAG: hypothetical protein WA908_04835, partial [Pontixanthobacter sp.]